MSIKNHIVLLLGILLLVVLVFNSTTVSADSCKTTTGTTCTVNCAVGTVSLVCGSNQCVGRCMNLEKTVSNDTLSDLVKDIYESNDRKIEVSKIIKLLKRGTTSIEYRQIYENIIFPGLRTVVPKHPDEDWRAIEAKFSPEINLDNPRIVVNPASARPLNNPRDVVSPASVEESIKE